MISRFVLPPALKSLIAGEARHAFPRECCGLIEGHREFETVIATEVHRTRNVAHQKDRFEIDPRDQFRALHAARERGYEIIGCYHSHPGGKPEPSAFDIESAGETGFVWVIAAVQADTVSFGAFVVGDSAFEPIALVDKGEP